MQKKSGCNNNSNNNNIIIFIIVCTENSLQSIQSKLPKLSWHSGNSRGSIMECVCVCVWFCVCLHVTSCSYCKSSVQWVKQCSESHLETFQRSLWGGSEVRSIVDGHVLSFSGTSWNFAKTPMWTRERRDVAWPQHLEAFTLHHWSIAVVPTCVKDEVYGW